MANLRDSNTMVKMIRGPFQLSAAFVFLGLLVAMPGNVKAAPEHQDSIDIVEGCEALSAKTFPRELGIETDFTRWICMGAIVATQYDMQVHHEMCPPQSGVSVKQYSQIVAKYMREHPDLMGHPYSEAIFIALSAAWPCD